MFRDDEAARTAYVAALERKAARVDELEDRIRELEAENRELLSGRPREPALIPASPGTDDIYIDSKIEAYVSALITATDPRRTDGILSGARASAGKSLLDAARIHARAAGRKYMTPSDVHAKALEVLAPRIVLQDPDADPRVIIRAILDVVDVP